VGAKGAEQPETPPDASGWWTVPVSKGTIAGTAVYLAVMTLLCLYFLFAVWPHPLPNLGGLPAPDTAVTPAATAGGDSTGVPSPEPAPARQPAVSGVALALMAAGDTSLARCFSQARALQRDTVPDPQCVTLARVGGAAWRVVIWDEQRVLLVILLAGILGSLLHGIRSLVLFVGDVKLRRSWLPQYWLQPFAGALIALVLYLVVRGGFFSSNAPVQATSPLGFAALAIISGLFMGQAMEKLKEIAETVFSRVTAGDPREDGAPAGGAPATAKPAVPANGGPPSGPSPGGAGGAPAITAVTTDAPGGAATILTIAGTGFTAASQVRLNGDNRTPASQADGKLTVTLTAKDREVLERGGELTLSVVNPADAGGASAPVHFPD